VDYKAAYEEAQKHIMRLEARLAELDLMFKNRHERNPADTQLPKAPVSVAGDEVAIEVAMSLEVRKPVIDVTVRKYVIEASDEDQFGRLALLVSEGFFDSPKKGEHINKEFIVRGWAAQTGRPSPKNLDMSKLAEYGFVKIVGQGGYQSVPGMKVNVKEVSAVA
jgi:hypothetical protein